MIPGFTNILRQDVNLCVNYVKKAYFGDNNLNLRVGLAGVRLLATLEMAFCGVKLVKATFFATSTLGALASGALAIALLIIGHDVFVLAMNVSKSKGWLSLPMFVQSQINQACYDFYKTSKAYIPLPSRVINLFEPVQDPLFSGTLLPGMWQYIASFSD